MILVRDHCHITGRYRGSAHQDCNLKLRIDFKTYKLPVIFHNLSGHNSFTIETTWCSDRNSIIITRSL